MSWVERIKNGIIITTGDGKVYNPLWKNATKTKEYNTTQFDFSNVSGSLVTRQEPKGRKYLLEIYFQGEDNIDQANEFETSADDKRAWVISHPLYDRIVVQPLSMNIDNTSMNVTKFSITVIETITEDNPRTSQDPTDKIIADQAALQEVTAQTYAELVEPEIEDIRDSLATNQKLFEEGKKIAISTEDFEAYFDAFKRANSAIDNVTSDILGAARAIQTLINAPAKFQQTVKNRIQSIENQFQSLSDQISNIFNPNGKTTYEGNSTGLLGAYTLALVTNTDYQTRREVLSYVDKLNDMYQSYLDNLELLQTDNYNSTSSWLPNYENALLLNNLINFTTARLFDIAVDARQERAIILEKDDNIVNLTHRFYGLDEDDENLDLFISTNEIGINEMLIVKKNRVIKYLL